MSLSGGSVVCGVGVIDCDVSMVIRVENAVYGQGYYLPLPGPL